VGYALNGQMIGVGAGQQSRVDCVKLAGRKVSTWYLRQHPKVQGLAFKAGTKRQDRVNARVRYIEGERARGAPARPPSGGRRFGFLRCCIATPTRAPPRPPPVRPARPPARLQAT
jgi:AICAR transformylase/IMP cyclohydrolase PurH